MAAITTVYASFLDSGSHVVRGDGVYGPLRVGLETIFMRFGVESTFVDTSELAAIERAIRPNTKLLYVETLANPTMKITVISAAATIARRHAIPLAVDDTFASPYLQRPLQHGARCGHRHSQPDKIHQETQQRGWKKV